MRSHNTLEVQKKESEMVINRMANLEGSIAEKDRVIRSLRVVKSVREAGVRGIKGQGHHRAK